MRLLMMMLLMMTTGAAASDHEEAFKKAAFQLTTAFQCSRVINDNRPYEWAKRKAVQLVGASTATDMISVVEAQTRDGSPLTDEICRNMLRNYRD